MKATGKYAKVEIDVSGTAVTIAELREWSISGETEKVDSSVAGDDWNSHEIGKGSWEGEATVLDVDQFWVANMFEKVTLSLFDNKDDTDAAYEGEASFNFERTTPYDDMIESTLSFTVSGALTTPKADAGTTTP